MRVPDLATRHSTATTGTSAATGTSAGATSTVTPTASADPALQVDCRGLIKVYRGAHVDVAALHGLDLQVERGELLAVVGACGSGKSTLLNILAGLDVPNAGTVTVAGLDLVAATSRRRLHYRRRVAGVVWQQTARNLLPDLTAAENVELPMRLAGTSRGRVARGMARHLLELVDAAAFGDRRPSQLSVGQQQRCAIAVAVANGQPLLLADEPTGELDHATGAEVYRSLRRINAELGTTVVLVTHDQQVGDQVGRIVAIRAGKICDG